MTATRPIERYLLLGTSLSHSLSPKIHQFSAECLGLNIDYETVELEAPDLEEFLRSHWNDPHLKGLNITFPFKDRVSRILGQREPINTLYRGEQFWEGTSTDATGFMTGLNHMSFPWASCKDLVFIGNGGVVKSLWSLTHGRRVHMLRRNSDRDREFPGCHFYPFRRESLEELARELGPEALLVQATSAPVLGDSLASLVPFAHPWKGGFVDLTYGVDSALMEAAKESASHVQDGLAMLVGQALQSQLIWWGTSASFEKVYGFLSK